MSLVNQIDTDALAKQGQKDGAVLFCAVVAPDGHAVTSWTYRAMPGSEAFEGEVAMKLALARFTPPIYNYQPVGVFLSGTAIYTANGNPRLRIFLNQDPPEWKRFSDFIAPQPVIGADSKFDGLTPPEMHTPVPITVIVDLRVKIDRTGQLTEQTVLAEQPPKLGFSEAALADFAETKFIPSFRDGDPADCDTILSICYKPAGD